MYYIGLDVHKKTISYCVKDAARRSESARNAGEETEIAYSSPAQIADATP